MVTLKRIRNILRYGIGEGARRRKRAVKDQVRQERFASDAIWQRGEDQVQRRYRSYQEYLEHQADKLDKVIDRRRENEPLYLEDFLDRFRRCRGLAGARSVLCLGARLGTEVHALHQLGYFAVGIDLNPGPDNPYVLPGDFHQLVFPDHSMDAVYTNMLDHVFDLARVTGEINRVLRPGGVFVADVLAGL